MAHFHAGLTTHRDETHLAHLDIDGTIPAWLNGALVRNGPAKFEAGGHSVNHWFDGYAMLHRFGIQDGQVSYSNKFLRTPSYNAAERGKIGFSEFATDPCRNIFQRVMSIFQPGQSGHNANVNLTRLAGEMIAMTETPLPVAFSAETLETVGVVDFEDELGFVSSTAHPHFDPARNVGYQHIIQYGRESEYNFVAIPNQKPLRRDILSSIKVPQPSYIHSFGMTERYLVLAAYPYHLNPFDVLLSGKPFIQNFHWHKDKPTHFYIVEKETGELILDFRSIEPCFAFHHINAFEDGDDIVVDLCAFDGPDIIDALYLSRLRGEDGGRLPKPSFRRFHLQRINPKITITDIGEHPIDLPRINYRYNGKPYRYAYGVSTHPSKPDDFLNALVRVDIERNVSEQWHEPGCYPSEPIFVANPDGSAENDGVILSLVLDGANNRSFLLVLSAETFTEVARARVPHTVPFTFHGQFFSA